MKNLVERIKILAQKPAANYWLATLSFSEAVFFPIPPDVLLIPLVVLNKSKALTLFSVSPANRNPYFNMVEKKENNFFNLIKIPKKMIFSRQRAPRVYDLNASFYWFRREFFNGKDKSQITEKSLIYEVNHICFDIDNSIDFDFLEFLIEKNKINDLI